MSQSRRIGTLAARSSWRSWAPGKVIVWGEHACVYGHPAIAVPIHLGTTATARRASALDVIVPAGVSQSHRQVLADAWTAATKQVGAPPLQLRVSSQLPVSMGLGSSGALAVACARVLLEAAGRKLSPAAVESVARTMEVVFHGRPSGVDHQTSAVAAPIQFLDGRVTRLRVPRRMSMVVALAGVRTSTRVQVAAFRTRKRKNGRQVATQLGRIATITRQGATALLRGDVEMIGELMNQNHRILTELGLSSPTVDRVISLATSAGATGAKLTGAGGDGGAVIAVGLHPRRIVLALRDRGIPAWLERFGGTP